jgi:hypothetical protein
MSVASNVVSTAEPNPRKYSLLPAAKRRAISERQPSATAVPGICSAVVTASQ